MNKQKGSFLVELMIGLLISITGILAMVAVFSQFEGQKRTTTQVSESVSNAALSMFPIQHYGKISGFGINNTSLLGCTVLTYDGETGETSNFRLAPLLITAGADNENDSIQFVIGNAVNYYSANTLASTMATSTSDFELDSRFGIRVGENVIVGQPGSDCSMRQVTSLPTGTGLTNNVSHNATSYLNSSGVSVSALHNSATGLGISYSGGAKLINVGTDPQVITFSINNNQLLQRINTGIASSSRNQVIGDNIVALKAVYGLDTNADGSVDSWTNVTPADTDLRQILGFRVAVISRAPLKEKTSGGVCNVTNVSNISWLGGNIDISGLPDWGCYRYRLIQTTVPLKNAMWSNS